MFSDDLFDVEPIGGRPALAGLDGLEAGRLGIGCVRGVGDPRLGLGAAVGLLAAVVPDGPVAGLAVHLVEDLAARGEVLHDGAAELPAVHLDLADGETGFDGVAVGGLQPFAAQLGELLVERQGLAGGQVARAQLALLVYGYAQPVFAALAALEGDHQRSVEADADGHVRVALVREDHLLLQPLVGEPVDDLALELVREMLVDGVVRSVRIVAALDLHLLVVLLGFRDDERLAFQDAVVVVVLLFDGDGVLVDPILEGVAPVLDAVGREEQGQTEDLRPVMEGLHLRGGGGVENLHAHLGLGQAHDIGAHRRNEQRRVGPLGELHGQQSVPDNRAYHLTGGR